MDHVKNEPVTFGRFLLHLAIAIVALIKILMTGDVVEPGGDQVAEFASA